MTLANTLNASNRFTTRRRSLRDKFFNDDRFGVFLALLYCCLGLVYLYVRGSYDWLGRLWRWCWDDIMDDGDGLFVSLFVASAN